MVKEYCHPSYVLERGNYRVGVMRQHVANTSSEVQAPIAGVCLRSLGHAVFQKMKSGKTYYFT